MSKESKSSASAPNIQPGKGTSVPPGGYAPLPDWTAPEKSSGWGWGWGGKR